MSETETKRPTPKQIDDLIFQYSVLQGAALTAKAAATQAAEDADVLKQKVIAMVQAFGSRHAEKSMRLSGQHHTATITTGTVTTVDDQRVDELRAYLEKQGVPELREKFFSERVTYQLVSAPAEVLQTLSLAAKVRNKITVLLALCSKPKPKAPSLKVDIVEAKTA